MAGHGLAQADVGLPFDRLPSALILDQRAFWIFPLIVLAMMGGGPLALDRAVGRRRSRMAVS